MHEKWKALSDRGIYGVLECIGQDIGDASQTGKGLASITGSITGMITGGFAGDKLSLKVKKSKGCKSIGKKFKNFWKKRARPKGRAFEQQEFAKCKSQNINAVEQITVKNIFWC